jgi:Ca2+-binding RTX toxin-like protein
LDCFGGGLSLTGSAWDDRIRSTRNGCPSIAHFDGGDPAPYELPSEFTDYPGGSLVALDQQASGIRYFDSPTGADPFVYVALGDSFASGEGTDRFSGVAGSLYETGENYRRSLIGENTLTDRFTVGGQVGNACHRSLINYAKLNIWWLQPARPSILVDRTCSGALAFPDDPESQPPITDPAVGSPDDAWSEITDASQLNQALWSLNTRGLSASQVDLVTASMGGNDVGFSDLIAACVASGVAREAIDQVDAAYIGSPLDDVAVSGAAAYLQLRVATCEEFTPLFDLNIDELLGDLEDDLPDAHDDLAGAFPEAVIYRVNYPAFLPESSAFPGDRCSLIDRRDARYAREVADRLNGVIDDAVTASNAEHDDRFVLVDIESSFGVNPLCPQDSDDQFIVSAEIDLDGLFERITDPTREPGIWLDIANDADILAACAATWAPLGGADCYADDALNRFAEWFTTVDAEFYQSFLTDVDPGVPPEMEDGARFENFRGLFHPNAAGVEIIACNVLAIYQDTDPGDCDTGSTITWYGPPRIGVAAAGTAPLTSSDPFTVLRDQIINYEIGGFKPFDRVDIWFRSVPADFGSVTADADGVARGSVTIPADAAAGAHRLVFNGDSPTGLARTVTLYVEVPGEPEPGQELGVIFELEPFETATVNYLGSEIGEVQADEDGNAFVEVIVADYAAIGTVELTVTGETTGPVTETIEAVARCDRTDATIIGTPGDDTLTGTDGPDVIAALGGNDHIEGLGGDDIICGGAGDDQINGGAGDDLLYGDRGHDQLIGGPGDDTADGGPESAACDAETTTDCDTTPAPGTGPHAQVDEATILAGETDDLDVLDNDTDPDDDLDETSLRIVTQPDTGTAEIINDGDGPVIRYTASPEPGLDHLTYEICDRSGRCDTAVVTITVLTDSECTIIGTTRNDTLVGTAGDDIICGLGGADTIRGLGGNDTLIGGPGDDTLKGGTGNDTLHAGRGDDTLMGGPGDDILLGGRGRDILNGQRGDDVLRGGPGADRLDGGAGDDQLRGGRGDDILTGGAGDDELFSGRGADLLNGGTGNDVLRGRTGSDRLEGGAGADLLYGGRGPDLLHGGPGDDHLWGRRGRDTLNGGTGHDTANGGPGNDTCHNIEDPTSCQ